LAALYRLIRAEMRIAIRSYATRQHSVNKYVIFSNDSFREHVHKLEE